jgi:hypothetical protein
MASTGTLLGGADTSALTNATDASRAHANDFYRQLALLQQQYQQQLAQQSALGRSYDRTIAGTAPSVAGTQLQRGVGQIADSARATAAGAGGNNAALANYGAIQAAGAAQAKANAEAAQLRAQEVAAAQANKAQLLNAQQQATGTQSGQATGAATTLGGQNLSGAGGIVSANQHENDAERNLAASGLNSIGSVATLASDENKKTDIKPVAGNEMESFLRHISGFNFKYKDGGKSPGEGPGERVGVMAQDVHSGGPIGKMVSDGKSIDMRQAIGALLAAVAHVNEKTNARSAA